MKKVKFGTLVPGDLFLYNKKLYVVTLESWWQDAYHTMSKVNCALIKMKVEDGVMPPLPKSTYLESECEIDKIDFHELNTIIELSKSCLTFEDLEIGDKFHFIDKNVVHVKISNINAISLLDGIIKLVCCDVKVEKI